MMKKRIAIISIIAVLVGLPFLLKKVFLLDENYGVMYLQIATILSYVSVTVGAILAFYQYYSTKKKESVKQAIDLAEYYKENVLKHSAIIMYVYSGSVLEKITRAKDKSKMLLFNSHELDALFTDGEKKDIEDYLISDEFRQRIEEAYLIFGAPLEFVEKSFSPQPGTSIKLSNGLIKNFFLDFTLGVLNNLEFFAMYYSHNVADETVVYESLAPTYIGFVEIMYYQIASNNNVKNVEHYYTNVVKLYKKWKERQNSSKEELCSAMHNNIKMGTSL